MTLPGQAWRSRHRLVPLLILLNRFLAVGPERPSMTAVCGV